MIDDAEAAVVRLLYRRLLAERLPMRQIRTRPGAGPWRPRAGKAGGSTSVVQHMRRAPVSTGTAYANR